LVGRDAASAALRRPLDHAGRGEVGWSWSPAKRGSARPRWSRTRPGTPPSTPQWFGASAWTGPVCPRCGRGRRCWPSWAWRVLHPLRRV